MLLEVSFYFHVVLCGPSACNNSTYHKSVKPYYNVYTYLNGWANSLGFGPKVCLCVRVVGGGGGGGRDESEILSIQRLCSCFFFSFFFFGGGGGGGGQNIEFSIFWIYLFYFFFGGGGQIRGEGDEDFCGYFVLVAVDWEGLVLSFNWILYLFQGHFYVFKVKVQNQWGRVC